MSLHPLPNGPGPGLKTSSYYLLPLDGKVKLDFQLISTSVLQERPAHGNFWLCPYEVVGYPGPDTKRLVRNEYRNGSGMYKEDEYASFGWMQEMRKQVHG